MVKYLNQISIQGKICSTPKTIRFNNCNEHYSFFIKVVRPDNGFSRLKVICTSEVYEKLYLDNDELYRIEGRVGSNYIYASNVIKIPVEFRNKQWENGTINLNKVVVRGVIIEKKSCDLAEISKRGIKVMLSTGYDTNNKENRVICILPDNDSLDSKIEIQVNDIVNFEGRLQISDSKKKNYELAVHKYYIVA